MCTRCLLWLLLVMQFSAVSPAYQRLKSSDDKWTTNQLKNLISDEVKGQSRSRFGAAEELGKGLAKDGPSGNFVAAATNLIRSTDPVIRAAVFNALNAKNDNVRRILPVLHAVSGDPSPINRRALLTLFVTVDPFSFDTLATLVTRVCLDPDDDTRAAAEDYLNDAMTQIENRRNTVSLEAIRQLAPLVDFLRDTTTEETPKQALGRLRPRLTNLIEQLTPHAAPRVESFWRTTLNAATSDPKVFIPTSVLIALCLLHIYYALLFAFKPVTLYSYAHAPYPWPFLPYAVAPTAYRYSARLIRSMVRQFVEQSGIIQDKKRLDQLAGTLRNWRRGDRATRRDAVGGIANLLQTSPDNKSLEFYKFLYSIAPQEALRIMEQVPTDPEIVRARKEMRNILQVPERTITKRGLILEHAIKQATTISGDFYNIIRRADDSLGVYMVDVNGHGLSAALHALKTYLLLSEAEPHWGMGRPKHELDVADDLMRKTADGLAVCMSFLEIDLTERTVRYASAGMPPALLFARGQSHPIPLLAAGIYIGKGYKFCRVQPAQAEHPIEEGDIIILYSDGITEARNSKDELFGIKGIVRAVEVVPSREALPIRESIMTTCETFSGEPLPRDDQSLVVIQIGGPSPKARRAEEPTLNIVPSPDCDVISARLRNAEDAPSALIHFMATSLHPFAVDHLGDPRAADRMNHAVLEALTNCLQHGTAKSEYVEIRVSSRERGTVTVELFQPQKWEAWDERLGRHRLNEIEARKRAFQAGERPELRFLGTQLIVAHSQHIECSVDGREQRYTFTADPNQT